VALTTQHVWAYEKKAHALGSGGPSHVRLTLYIFLKNFNGVEDLKKFKLGDMLFVCLEFSHSGAHKINIEVFFLKNFFNPS
jgi:hypothetical protein